MKLASHNPPVSTFQVEGIRAAQHYTWLPEPHSFPFHQDVPLLLSIKLTTWKKVPFVRHHPPKRWHSNSCTMKTCVVIVTDIPFSNHNSQPRQPATDSAAFFFILQPALEMQEQDKNITLKWAAKPLQYLSWQEALMKIGDASVLPGRYTKAGALSLFTMQNPPCISYTLHFTTDA